MQNHKNFRIWQDDIQLVKDFYEICKKLPKSEEYVLSSQIRRAVISIPANIAEGASRLFSDKVDKERKTIYFFMSKLEKNLQAKRTA